MRTLLLPIAPTFLLLCGCAGSVIFGHTIGARDSTATVPASAPDRSAPPPPAPAVPPVASPPAVAAVAEEPEKSPPPPPVFSDARAGAVSVAFTTAARAQIDADPGFDRDALLAAIQSDLRAHQLLEEGVEAHSDRTVEIMIDDFAIRPASNAVVLGYAMSNATLSGSIELRNVAGHALHTYTIRADRRLTTRAGDAQAPSLDPLYRRFADMAVSQLTGAPAPSVPSSDDPANAVPR